MEVFEYKPVFVKRLKIAAFIAAGVSLVLCFTSIGDYKRDEKVIADARAICSLVSNEKSIKVSGDVYHKWNFQFYVLRFGDIV